MTTARFQKGNRVKLSAWAIERNVRPTKEKVFGTIASNKQPASMSYSVLWDDRKTTNRLHEHFLEKVKP